MTPEVLYIPGAVMANDLLFRQLRNSVPWEQRIGRMGPAPRLVAWYGEGSYEYSGILHGAKPMTSLIGRIREQVEGYTTNLPRAIAGDGLLGGVLLNLYRDGRDSVAWHSDDEPEMGPLIASVSFGATRKFQMRCKAHPKEKVTYELRAGDLLVMYGACQQEWEHCIPKTKLPVGERINLTFRQLKGR